MKNLKRKREEIEESRWDEVTKLIKNKKENANKENIVIEEEKKASEEMEETKNDLLSEEDIPIKKKVFHKHRAVYTPETKQMLFDLMRDYGIQKVHEKTSVPYETLRTIKKILTKFGAPRKRGQKIKHPEFDDELKNWIIFGRRKNLKLTAKRIFGYARKTAKERGLEGIKFSWGWFRHFLRSHTFSLRKPTSNLIKPIDTLFLKSITL